MKMASTLIVAAVIAFSGIFLPAPYGISLGQSQPPRLADSKSDENAMERQIIAKEREGLDALKTGDLDRFGNLTADEAVLVDAHGPASKAQVLKNVAGFTLTEYSMEDVRFVRISPETGLISYKITETGISHGREFTAQAYVSSVWTERGNKWLCLFSQETGVPRQVIPPA
ncbi:MAG: nuclear transport factor 2 family protein [Candidatus Sulfotelmatobacter sp.]|jgi:ketosteroid isomerase-like protein